MTWTSPYFSTSNSYIKYCIKVDETATSTVNNTSTIRVRVLAWRTNTGYTTNYDGECWVKIDGSYAPGSPNTWEYPAKPISYNSDTVLCDLTGITINHDADGTKTIQVAACFDLYSGGTTKVTSSYQSFNVTLTSLDTVAPVVSFTTSNIGVNGFTINATSDVACNVWQYSINGGSSWTQFSTTSGTSASTTITGLSPNTTYTTLVKAQKASNSVYGTSASTNVKTIGNAVLNSVSTVTADASTVQIAFNATVYVTSYTHTLVLKDSSNTVLTLSGLTLADGSNTITLTSSQRTTLLTYMASMKTFTGTFELTTYSGATQIGSVSSKTATVQTTAANSAPTFTAYTYVDNNSTVTAITGDNQVMVQGVSTIQVTATAATAKNNASIASYSVSFGNITGSSTTTTITPTDTINTSGTVVMTVSAIDTRGYSTSVTKNVTVIPYSSIVYTSSTIRRTNDIEDVVQLTFDGSFSSLLVNSVEKNSITYCRYRYKKTSDADYGSYVNILSGVTTSGTSFSYTNNSLVSLDADYSWNLQVVVKDALTEKRLNLVVSQGVPLIALRSKKVGINVAEPTKTLDVGGDIAASGGITAVTLNGATIGSSPVFTDTIATQELTTTSANYPLIFSKTTNTNTTKNYTNTFRRNNSIYANPNSGTIFAPNFTKNDSSGNALVKLEATSSGDIGLLGIYTSGNTNRLIQLYGNTTGGRLKLNNTSGTTFLDAYGDVSGSNLFGYMQIIGTSGNMTWNGGNNKLTVPAIKVGNYDYGTTELYTGSLSSGSTTFNYGNYKCYVVIGHAASSGSAITTVIPASYIGTTAKNFCFSDETNWYVFSMVYSSTTCTLAYVDRNSTGYIEKVYGVN